ncbi:VOC family protein [Neptunomonas japonica]|uniref:Lactoylglutathione lyase n=1 Tax=Neptunomonas japonica JAMM 1380 TaxID=1441457 RepID=A0A7R6SX74_9GAMM|nr:VOC family protein [Neptunomonas japonica]BBB30392.1 lactoylglutathione lyase [Neptunomonas japonica JAMM 1380]
MRHDHILLRTQDLDRMIQFFTEILKLEEGTRPAFSFPGAWLYSGNQPLIHLALSNEVLDSSAHKAQEQYLGKRSATSQQGIVDHIAFQGDDYTSLISRLKGSTTAYFERSVPVSSEHQFFVTGPEGLLLEILFNQDKLALTRTVN